MKVRCVSTCFIRNAYAYEGQMCRRVSTCFIRNAYAHEGQMFEHVYHKKCICNLVVTLKLRETSDSLCSFVPVVFVAWNEKALCRLWHAIRSRQIILAPILQFDKFNEAYEDADVWEHYSTSDSTLSEWCEQQQNMIDLSSAICCVNFDASVPVFLVSVVLPVHCFVETSCMIGLHGSVQFATTERGTFCDQLTHICVIMSAVTMPHVNCIPTILRGNVLFIDSDLKLIL
jgi:hypothetical protein